MLIIVEYLLLVYIVLTDKRLISQTSQTFSGADLALLYLPRPSKHPTIRLAISPVDDQYYKSGVMATVAGWGSTSPHDTQQISQDLRHAKVKVMIAIMKL